MGLCCCKEKLRLDDNSQSDTSSISRIVDSNFGARPVKDESATHEFPSPILKKMSLPNLDNNIVVMQNKVPTHVDVIFSDNELVTENLLLETNDLVPITETKQMPSSFIDQVKTYFYLRIYIEHLEVLYKQCDDFGLAFKPYVELCINDQESFRITNNDEEKLNNSAISDKDNSVVSNGETSKFISQNSFSNIPNATLLKEGKIYIFKTTKSYTLTKEAFYHSLLLSIRNENNLDANLPPIVIGDARLPINLLENKFTENCFDGLIELELRNTSIIGYLKVIISMSTKNINEHDILINKLTSCKKVIPSETFLDNLDPNIGVISKPHNTWDQNFTHFFDMNPEVLDNYFIMDLESRDAQLEKANEFYDKVFPTTAPSTETENINDDHAYPHVNINLFLKNSELEHLYKTFKESIKEQNFVLLYELFISFVNLTLCNEFAVINDFFNNFTAEDTQQFFSIPSFTHYNLHLLNIYLIFLHNVQKYLKSNKSFTMRSNKYFDDAVIIEIIVEIVKVVLERSTMNKKVINGEYSLELRDCLMWCINNFNEAITLPSDLISTRTNKNEVEEQKRKDYNQLYDNCLHLISNRILMLKTMAIFLEDSEVISGITRTFRKMIQVLTNDRNVLLDKSKDAASFSVEFRILLISQNDGLFVTTIRAVLAKYYHYPEIHNNLLIVLFQITNYLDDTHLIQAAEKLNLEEFRRFFDPFRSKLRAFCKLLNNLHLNILANLSDIAKIDSLDHEPILKLIMLDLKAFYRNTSNKKRLEDFKTRKLVEVEIHETITRIAVNVTKNEKLAYSLLESNFYRDIVQYLVQISTSVNEKDFIQLVSEKKRKNTDEVKRYVMAIVESTQTIFINIMNSDDNEISDTFCNQILIDHNIEDSDQLVHLFGCCRNLLLSYGCSVTKLDKNLEILKDMFE